jgi:cytochrome c oxidase subunit II
MRRRSGTVFGFSVSVVPTFPIVPMFLPSLLSRTRAKLARSAGLVVALAATALLSGCDVSELWRMDGHQSTLHVAGPVALAQRNVFYVTCWVTFVLFILVGSTLAYATWKFRARTAADEHAEPPPQGHGNPLIELSLIAGSICALVIIAVPTLKGIWYTYDVAPEAKGQVFEVNATGYQWWFRFEYPTEQAAAEGTTKLPLVAANELVIPAGRPVRINLRTMDVIHSFWIPKLAGKVDMIPNRANFLWLQADEPGYFWGQCAEYCGDSHAVMRFRVIALEPKEFAAWLQEQEKPARTVEAPKVAQPDRFKAQFASLRPPEDFRQNETGISNRFEIAPLDAWRAQQVPEKTEDAALIAKGKTLFTAKTCIACHTIRGHGAQGITGPDLTHVGARTTLAAGLIENTPEQLRRWIHNPGAVKPGNKMAKGFIDNNIHLEPDEEIALVAYLESLK